MTRFPLRTFGLSLLVFTFLSLSAAGAETVWLSSLDLSNVSQEFGKPQKDRSVDRHPLSIAGQKFEHGLGTHAVGRLVVDCRGACTGFHAAVGVDDEVSPGKGTVEFKVLSDGKTLWSSGIMRRGEPAKVVDLDLTGIQQLQLRVGDGGDGNDFDHADWADARFEVNGEPPRTIPLKFTDPVIDMTPPVDAPRIHPPFVYGIFPGTPLVFSIPATGKEPLAFSADGLPAGLSLDGNTGLVTGMISAAGTSDVIVHVSNSEGSAQQKIQIIADHKLALTPPLGWNSYDGYGDNVTEAETRANAAAVAKYLRPHGWQYVIVDYCWYDPGAHDNDRNKRAGADLAMDEYGRLLPAPNRFPSATGTSGFKAIADDVHAMRLRFGVHLMRGIPRKAVKKNLPIFGSSFHAADAANTSSICVWCPDMFGVRGDTAAGQAWYDSIFKQYAEWGLDFVKVDDLSQPYSTAEITAIRNAIDHCGRSIVFSTSPGPTPLTDAAHIVSHANMWRATGDFWDDWRQLSAAMDVCSAWSTHAGPGHWPDMDMLPIGHLSIGNRSVGRDRTTHFSRSEQLTLLTLWSLFPSPLMLGGNFADADPWEIALLTNDEVLGVNQDALGQPAKRVFNHSGLEVWKRNLGDGSVVVGFFNRTDDDAVVQANWSDLGLDGSYSVRDLWLHKDMGQEKQTLSMKLGGRSAAMFKLVAASAHP